MPLNGGAPDAMYRQKGHPELDPTKKLFDKADVVRFGAIFSQWIKTETIFSFVQCSQAHFTQIRPNSHYVIIEAKMTFFTNITAYKPSPLYGLSTGISYVVPHLADRPKCRVQVKTSVLGLTTQLFNIIF